MFKNVTVYRTSPGWAPAVEQLEEALAATPFVPCGATQEKSFGWVPPRGDAHAALVESIGGHRLMSLMIETKAVPGSVVQRLLEERTAAIEASTGRKPGRKESRDMKEELVRELLPMAFPKTSRVMVWHDPEHQRLLLDTTSTARADEVTTALVRAFDGLQLSLLDTATSPQVAMTNWLTLTDVDEWPPHLAPGREVELKSSDEQKSVVRFTRHHLDAEQMQMHIAQGKLPTQMGLDWDGRVAFVLTESLQLRKVSFLDGVFEDNASSEDSGGFDADVAIATGELSALLNDLLAALGGQTD
ncbi:MAG: recombination-associated protein RdgC [Serpentinimonas sp.]|nr:recombination-associated protein RdgC [Serpentinimonas sp.]